MELIPICDESYQTLPNVWYSLSSIVSTNVPLMRVGHTAVHVRDETNELDKGRIFLIGGANPDGCFDEIYSLDLNQLEWFKFNELSIGLGGRYEHTSILNEKKIFIFGGANQSDNLNDLIAFHIDETRMEPVSSVEQKFLPSKRTFHSGVALKNRLFVFGGGSQAKNAVDDTNVYLCYITANKWLSLTSKSDSNELPRPRQGHLMVNWSDERVYMHGGMNENEIMDDLWSFDMRKLCWTKVNIDDSEKPCARAAHGGICVNQFIYIFGGLSESGEALNDLWRFDTTANKWHSLNLDVHKPPNRLDFAYCKVSLRVKKSGEEEPNLTTKTYFFVHGGMDTLGNVFDDSFLIELNNNNG